jgi:Holliday junction resolvase RusA-like endonuclease
MPADPSVAWALARELMPVRIVARFTIDGEPVSKNRARFTRKGVVYTPQKTKDAEVVVGWKFREAAPGHVPDKDTTYGVFAVFFAGTRQRRDVDNMLKLICDGLNGVAWDDDSQVEEISGRRGHDDKENARTEVLIYRVGEVLRETRDCEQCGASFPFYPSLASRRFCNRKCQHAWHLAQRGATCEQCGEAFTRARGSAAKFCSVACKAAHGWTEVVCDHCQETFPRRKSYTRVVNYCSDACRTAIRVARSKGQAKGLCQFCGGGTSRKEYTRCDPCRLAGSMVNGLPREPS